MRVNCNISAIIANNNLGQTGDALSASIERLSSGLRINKASDDSSGMAVSKKMHTQIRALERASSNTTDGISVVQTAEASLGEMEGILQRMRELAVQAANGTNSDSDREALHAEISQLQAEVDRISTDTEYNTMPLLDGTLKRRAYADVEGVKMFDMSTTVSAGEYTFGISTAAEPASVILDVSAITETGTLGLDSVDVHLSSEETFEQTYDRLVEAANLAGLDIAGDSGAGTVTLTQRTSGSAHTIDIRMKGVEGVTVSSADAAYPFSYNSDVKEYTCGGVDAVINLDTSTKFSGTASATADGNIVTVKDVNSFEMTFEIPNGETTDPVTFKVTDIGTMNIQAGANEGQQIAIDIPQINCHTLGLDHLNIASMKSASLAIDSIDQAIDQVSAIRSRLGAYQNRLETTQASLATYNENLTTALSGIEDCDMAEEMTSYTTYNVKTQAATSVLSQANERPQTVLQLLQ